MKLTVKQKEWLLELWKASEYCPSKMLSVVNDKPPTIVMRALEKKGLCKDIMGTFWSITDDGREYAKTIY